MQKILGWDGLFAVSALLGGTLIGKQSVANACDCDAGENWRLERDTPDASSADELWPSSGVLYSSSLLLLGEASFVDVEYVP